MCTGYSKLKFCSFSTWLKSKTMFSEVFDFGLNLNEPVSTSHRRSGLGLESVLEYYSTAVLNALAAGF